MVKWNRKSRIMPTGARNHPNHKKKKYERGSEFLGTRIGERLLRTKRAKGGSVKPRLLRVEKINVAMPGGRVKRAKVVTVEKNTANPHFVRMNIITRGAVVKTDLGSVRITSRPGQDGIVNGVLVEEKK